MSRMLRALLLAAALAGLAGCQKTGDAAFGAKVRAYLLDHPEVLIEVQQKLQAKQAQQALDFTRAAVRANRAALEQDPRDLVVNPDGKVTVVEVFDYNCAYCKAVAPELIKLIEGSPDVRFVFKEYPFQTDQSLRAAKLALGAQPQGRSFELYKRFMLSRPLDDAAIDRALAEAGVDAKAAAVRGDSAEVMKHLQDNVELVQKTLGIGGTPYFLVGDEVIDGAKLDELKAAIAKARKAGKT